MIIFSRREFTHGIIAATMNHSLTRHAHLLLGKPLGDRYEAPSGEGDASDDLNAPLESVIFPTPKEIVSSSGDFILDNDVRVLVPSSASEEDLFLASSLINDLRDRCGLYLKMEKVSTLPKGQRFIVLGSKANSLIKKFRSDLAPSALSEYPGPEGYILHSDATSVVVAGSDDRGAFYGMQTLRQILISQERHPRFLGVQIRDWPDKPFRGIYLFLPGRDNLVFFKRFVSEYMAFYKFNTLIMEMGASMRLESHPELNNGWVEFARDTNYSYRNYPPKPFHDVEQNSSHQDVADGSYLEKEEVADLARWLSRHHIELVPELASLTHAYYLLTKHRELAAVPENKWPDISCPTDPKSYSFVFEIYDEYIDLLKPKSFHIGHDELFLPLGASAHCEDTNIGELFGEDVRKIHDHLASRGVKTQLWGDMLLQSVRGIGTKEHTSPDGWRYRTPGGMTPEQVERLIPKDCLIFNWFWHKEEGTEGEAEANEAILDKMGFQQIFGNLTPDIENYASRKKRSSLLGGAPSAWSATNETTFGKDLMAIFLGSANLLWTGEVIPDKALSARTQSMLPGIRNRLTGLNPPSLTEANIVPLDISNRFNTAGNLPSLRVDLGRPMTGVVKLNKVPFDLRSVNGKCAIAVGTQQGQSQGLPHEMNAIRVREAVISLVFLHASARRSSNKESFRLIWDQQDTADLLGWYEIVYEDQFVLTIPIRYGVNILEWDWDRRSSAQDYCYAADALAIGREHKSDVTFFAFEWINPRLGKVVDEIRLKGTRSFRGGSDDFNNEYGPIIESNAVVLKAVSMIKKRN